MADTIVSTGTAGCALEILPAFPELTEPTTSTESADPAAAATSTALAITTAPAAATALETTSAPTATTKSAGSKAHKDKKDKNDDEKAINKCMRAWNYAYRKTFPDLAEDQSDWPAEKAANAAYLQATPPLIGYKNICEFIACINYASVTGIVTRREAAHYLDNAKVALSAIYHQPKPSTSQTQDVPTGADRCSGQSSNPPPQEEMK